MSKSINTLTKDSIMEFGKYKGKKMSDIPGEYYVWVYNQYRKDELKFRLGRMAPVIAYVLRNFDEIQAHYSINTKHNFDKKAWLKGFKKK